MDNFIELSKKNGEPVFVNVSYIFSVEPDKDGCIVRMSPGGFNNNQHMIYTVIQSYQSVKELIGQSAS